MTTTPSLPEEPEDARDEAHQALDDLYTKPRQDELGQTAYAAVPPPLASAMQPPESAPQSAPESTNGPANGQNPGQSPPPAAGQTHQEPQQPYAGQAGQQQPYAPGQGGQQQPNATGQPGQQQFAAGQAGQQPQQPFAAGQAQQQPQQPYPGQPQQPYGAGQPQQPFAAAGSYGQPGSQPGTQSGGSNFPPPPPPGQYGAPGYGYGQMPGPAGIPTGLPIGMPPFAGWWQRVGAWLLDNFLVGAALELIVSWSSSSSLQSISGAIGFIWAIYNAYLGGSTGQSYGKRAVGIRLARLTDGKPVGGGNGLLRWFLSYLVFFFLCFVPGILNYLWPLWDQKHQTWSDKIIGSVVVRV